MQRQHWLEHPLDFDELSVDDLPVFEYHPLAPEPFIYDNDSTNSPFTETTPELHSVEASGDCFSNPTTPYSEVSGYPPTPFSEFVPTRESEVHFFQENTKQDKDGLNEYDDERDYGSPGCVSSLPSESRRHMLSNVSNIMLNVDEMDSTSLSWDLINNIEKLVKVLKKKKIDQAADQNTPSTSGEARRKRPKSAESKLYNQTDNHSKKSRYSAPTATQTTESERSFQYIPNFQQQITNWQETEMNRAVSVPSSNFHDSEDIYSRVHQEPQAIQEITSNNIRDPCGSQYCGVAHSNDYHIGTTSSTMTDNDGVTFLQDLLDCPFTAVETGVTSTITPLCPESSTYRTPQLNNNFLSPQYQMPDVFEETHSLRDMNTEHNFLDDLPYLQPQYQIKETTESVKDFLDGDYREQPYGYGNQETIPQHISSTTMSQQTWFVNNRELNEIDFISYQPQVDQTIDQNGLSQQAINTFITPSTSHLITSSVPSNPGLQMNALTASSINSLTASPISSNPGVQRNSLTASPIEKADSKPDLPANAFSPVADALPDDQRRRSMNDSGPSHRSFDEIDPDYQRRSSMNDSGPSHRAFDEIDPDYQRRSSMNESGPSHRSFDEINQDHQRRSSMNDSGPSQRSFDGIDPDLIKAAVESMKTGSVTPLIKKELKLTILSRRAAAGKADIPVNFEQPKPHKLTEEEKEKRQHKKDLNRVAAASFRERNKAKADAQKMEIRELELKKKQLEETVVGKSMEKELLLGKLATLGFPPSFMADLLAQLQ